MKATLDPKTNLFFLFGCARSGTTSLCHILDLAENACCLVEPSSQLYCECREYWDGKRSSAQIVADLRTIILSRATKSWQTLPIYGEKNISLGLFAPLLLQAFPCKLIYVTRDGRDCVNSMRYWHARMFGNFYREAQYQPPLSPRAQKVVDNLPIPNDLCDYGRPRPLPGDPWFKNWSRMTHHQMLCWYWNAWNLRILDELQKVPSQAWRKVDYSSPQIVDQIMDAIQFLGLEGIRENIVESLLEKKINSINDRIGEKTPPTWRNWSDEELDQFWEICTPAMQRLNYFTPSTRQERRWTPEYGNWWRSDTPEGFFESIYHDRLYQHNFFFNWAKPLLDNQQISSVLDVCCGHSIGYEDFFSKVSYTGIDISPKEIAWCRSNYLNERHEWICEDFIRNPPKTMFDLVICQGTIENMYDMDALLINMAACAKYYIYLAGFSGFYDKIQQHEYVWNKTYTSYENKFSLQRAQHILQECGFSITKCKKIITHKSTNPFESILIAKRIS